MFFGSFFDTLWLRRGGGGSSSPHVTPGLRHTVPAAALAALESVAALAEALFPAAARALRGEGEALRGRLRDLLKDDVSEPVLLWRERESETSSLND